MPEFIRTTLDNLSVAMIFPVAVIVLIVLFYIYYTKIVRPERGTTEWMKMKKEARRRRLTFLNTRYPLDKNDILPIAVITGLFLIFAVFNLGKTTTIDVQGEIEARANDTTLYEGHDHTNNMYFDEIYFVRTAVEHINGNNPYEWTHPPLGKNIIAASILIFGESPFGWRLIGAICGVLMLPFMYAFIKNMFGKTPIAVCGTLLLGFDFMRLVQSRIGTIDTYAVLFILISYYFMYRLLTTDPDAPFRKSLPALALSGIFFGLGFAIKWVGFYAGAGLLVIYLIRLMQLGMYYSNEKKKGFGKYLLKTLGFSVLFFVIIPAVVYYVNYIPYGVARGMTPGIRMLFDSDFFNVVWNNQKHMYNYHANLEATHGGSSFWWQWLLDIKPILYVNRRAGDLRATYGAFGNPVLYWGGLIAMIIMALRTYTHKDGKALFILIGYLAQLLPWVAVTRIVFAYHYLPGTIFLVLAMAHVMDTMMQRDKPHYRRYVYGLTAAAGGAFAMFYPMLAGVYLPIWYYSGFLKWLPSWPF